MRARALALGLVVCLGCKRTPPAATPVLDKLVVRCNVLGVAFPRPDDTTLLELAKEAVASAPGPLTYRPAAPDAGVARSHLDIDIELAWIPPNGGKQGVLSALVKARITPRDEDGPLHAEGRAGAVEKENLDHAPTLAEVTEHLKRALGLIVGGAVRREQLWLSPPATVRAALGGTDFDLRDHAIEIVGIRRDRAAVPLLLPMLQSDDADLRDEAIGAIAELGDPSTVKPLAALARFDDLTQLPKILAVIARVGGPEAIAYLEFVAGGHPVPEIRDEAKRDLEHLRARAAASQ